MAVELTIARLKELLHYDPETGVFTRKKAVSGNSVGQVVGHTRPDGYVSIRIDYRPYLAHRLAWLYMTGGWPAANIDHQNRTPSDNRWTNLRPANQSQNISNTKFRSNNTSGFKGVSRSGKKWAACVKKDYKTHHLGLFDDPAAAHNAYIAAAKALHGEFASWR
jgi:hypothetical protein